MHKYEIIVRKSESRTSATTYHANVFTVTVINDVRVLDNLGYPEVSFTDSTDKEKVIIAAMKIVENDKNTDNLD